MRDKMIAVCGPTASGKTSFAIRLAQMLGGEVVSMDSMQIYKRMSIGTAAPTETEMMGVPHHMIGIVGPEEAFSCADYTVRAEACIREIIARGKMPILCGGTGLYLDSLLRVSAFSEAEGSEEIRARLQKAADDEGNESLHARLAEVDPDSADAIHPNNVRRVIRALEIYESTGITKTEWDRRSLLMEPKYDAGIVVLDFHNRETLYSRIDRRVDVMLADGLEDEARALYEEGLIDGRYVAAQAIGYKEFIPYFRGECTLAEAADQVRLSTRRYAKRQLTWFRRYTDALWLYPDAEGLPLKSADILAEEAIETWKKDGFL